MKVTPVSLLIVFFLCSVIDAFPQKRKSAIIKYDTAARPGSVVRADGSLMRGAIVFNDNEGIVTLYDKSSDELRAFNARTLVKFQMDSSKGERERVFYSLEFDGANTGMKRPEFFEVLHELDSFIVLVKIERLKTEARRDILEPRQSPILVKRASRKFTQTQIVYFLDMEGNFEPYLKILEKEIDGDLFDINEEHNHYINADLFRKYTGQHFPALVAYAKQNDLSFKRKEHIVLILDHYKRLARR